ncbi:hypothetical protein QUF63_16615 [Anaerolineales bacterium HSG25]|nr:hypothetical protein [Anaerolineales bacterium HSG25]
MAISWQFGRGAAMVFVSAKQHLRAKLHTSQERSSGVLQGVFFSLKVWHGPNEDQGSKNLFAFSL